MSTISPASGSPFNLEHVDALTNGASSAPKYRNLIASHLNVSQMSAGERWQWVIGEAARQTPGEAGHALLGLLEPHNLAALGVGAAAIGVLNLTGLGSAATILAIGDGLLVTGMEGFNALRELQSAIGGMDTAHLESDLKAVASHVAKVAVHLTAATISALVTGRFKVEGAAPEPAQRLPTEPMQSPYLGRKLDPIQRNAIVVHPKTVAAPEQRAPQIYIGPIDSVPVYLRKIRGHEVLDVFAHGIKDNSRNFI